MKDLIRQWLLCIFAWAAISSALAYIVIPAIQEITR